MGKYTKSHAKGRDLDGFVAENLDIVVREIRKQIPEVKSVILMGGYGRGEGAVDMHMGKPRLLNDFDVYVITERQLSDDFLEEVALKCSNMIGKGGIAHPEGFEQRYDFDKFFHVDIRCLPESRLPKLPPTVRYYEMRNSSTVLYGDKEILKKFPRISAGDIPKPEALRLIMNRMMLLIMSFNPKFILKKGYMSPDEHGIIAYYIAKSYLTAAEALLIFSGRFKPTYGERAALFSRIYKREFPGLHGQMPDLARKVRQFTRYKAAPDPSRIDPIDEWFRCRDALGLVFRFCLHRFLGRELPGEWIGITDVLKRQLGYPYFEPYARYFLRKRGLDNPVTRALAVSAAQLYMNFKYWQKLRGDTGGFGRRAISFLDHGVRILYTTPLILYSMKRDGDWDKGMVLRAMQELDRSYPVIMTDDWEQAKRYYLKSYRLYYLQRFV